MLDLEAEFAYFPGTMIFIAGKVSKHEVSKWNKGERIALAFYMKDAVHDRLTVERPPFTRQKEMLKQFLHYSKQ
ncbi:hypothetical protein ID866_13296 [Astraeus odoratus]|nr:hypothetical protein ID866_13296 [Astraeus odoratus]